jgi:hypothetical protein
LEWQKDLPEVSDLEKQMLYKVKDFLIGSGIGARNYSYDL